MNKPFSRIILIGPTESSMTKRGNRFPNIANYLASSGDNVTYITSNFYHAEKRYFSKQEVSKSRSKNPYKFIVFRVLGYKTNISARRVISNFIFSFAVFIFLLFYSRKNDRILLPSRPVELIFFLGMLRRIKKIKIILDIQDIWPDMLGIENGIKKTIFTRYCNFFLHPSLKHYDYTIHTAPSFKGWLKRYAPGLTSEFIPLGWENERWISTKGEDRIDVKEKKINLVCVAKLQHQIDIMPILKVLNIRNNLQFTLIGEDGMGDRYSEVSKYISENEIQNVNILGITPREEVVKILKGMHIGILPMISPSIPNKIFDYLGSDLPIVVLGKNDSADFVKEHEIGWTCDYNWESLLSLVDSLNWEDLKNKKDHVISVKNDYARDTLHKKIYKILHN